MKKHNLLRTSWMSFKLWMAGLIKEPLAYPPALLLVLSSDFALEILAGRSTVIGWWKSWEPAFITLTNTWQGELILVAFAVWCLVHAVRKVSVKMETEQIKRLEAARKIEIEMAAAVAKNTDDLARQIASNLSKYDGKLSALFSHLAGDSRRRDFTDAFGKVTEHERNVQDAFGTWDAAKAEDEPDYGTMRSSGSQFSGLFIELDIMLGQFQDDYELDLIPHLNSVRAEDVQNAATPHLEKITKDGHAEGYRMHMQKIALIKRILSEEIRMLDERMNADKRVLFPKNLQ